LKSAGGCQGERGGERKREEERRREREGERRERGKSIVPVVIKQSTSDKNDCLRILRIHV
jgi:hypothetical protein